MVANENSRGLVGMWAKKYAPMCRNNPACDVDDLMQAGLIGVELARGTWNPERGAWSTWASYYIRDEMLKALGRRRADVVSLDAPIAEDGLTLGDLLEDDSLPPAGEAVERRETVQAVREAVNRLEGGAVERVYLRGMSRADAAKDLRVSLNKLDSMLQRERMQLRRDRRLDEETRFCAHKSLAAFMRDHTSVVEASVIWREARRAD